MASRRVVEFPEPLAVRVVEERREPPPADHVELALAYSAISPGTELAILRGLQTQSPFPRRVGYSAVGRVATLGAGVQGLAIGQPVASFANHGSFAMTEAARCRALPDGLAHREASMYRLVSIAMQGARKAQVQLGDRVAVTGLGVIGNLAGQLAFAAGAARVTGIDPQAWRRQVAEQCAFTGTAASADDGPGGYDVVIEASGVPAAVPQALGLARRLGRVVLLGSSRGLVEKVDFYRDVHCKGLTVIGAHDTIRSTHDEIASWRTAASDESAVLALMNDGRVDVAPLISDVMPGDEAPRAYQRLCDADEKLMTIVLQWPGA